MENMRNNLPEIDMEKLQIVLDTKERYLDGKLTLDEARAILRERVKTLRPYEIALAEQELKTFDEDECRKEDIQQMMELFQDVLDRSRPDLPDDHPIMCYLRENDEMRRLRVRPGITGLWQISGRSDLSWDETIRLDLYYIDNWSPLQDLSILTKTVQAVLSEHDVQELLNAVLALLPVPSLGMQVTVVISVSQVKNDSLHQRASPVRSCFQTASISPSVSVMVHRLSL